MNRNDGADASHRDAEWLLDRIVEAPAEADESTRARAFDAIAELLVETLRHDTRSPRVNETNPQP